MNDDHFCNGMLIVLPSLDGCLYSGDPILICLIPDPEPTAYMFVNLFWSVISIPLKWPVDVNVIVSVSSLVTP